MLKKSVALIGSILLTSVCVGALIMNNADNNNTLSKASGERTSYSLTIDSPLYVGGGQSGEGYTTVQTTFGNDVKIKYNKLNSFADGINNIEEGSYIEIVNNGDIHGLAGVSNVTITCQTEKECAWIRVSYGWDEGVMMNTLQEIALYTSMQNISFDIPNSPSYIRIDSARYSNSYSVNLEQITFTYSCETIVDPYVTGDYVLNFEEDHFEVARYKGTNRNLTIPSEYNGYPITAIADNFAVDMGKEDIDNVTLPSSIKRIGQNAFNGAENLLSINLDNVENIDYRAFFNCYKLGNNKDFHIYASGIAQGAFVQTGLTSVFFHSNSGTISFDSVSFGNNFSLLSVSFDQNLTITTGGQVFNRCNKLRTVYLPKYINTFWDTNCLEYSTFWGCEELANIIYSGTMEQWEGIEKSSYWYQDLPATTTIVRCSDGNVNIRPQQS